MLVLAPLVAPPRLLRAVEVLLTSLRLLLACKKADVFCVAAVPSPRLVLAVVAEATSLKLLAADNPPMELAEVGICPNAAASVEADPLARPVILLPPIASTP
jgi:hypothetical protein